MEAPSQKSAKGMKLTHPSSSSSSSSSCFITNLPSPILMEILCRLPLKSLAACKCVCLSWLHLSRDPHFPQLHQARAPNEVLFQLWEGRGTLKLHMGNFHCLNYFDPLDVKLNTVFELPKFSVRPDNTLDYHRTVIGDFYFSNSCNGLLCYYGGIRNRFVMVWNPCTSEFITIPTLAAPYYCHYGLGFSRKANKFKLLRLVSQQSQSNVGAEILTIEKGCSWSTLGHCSDDVWNLIGLYSLPSNVPTFLYGTLHWLDIRGAIITFDFEDEQFGRVPLPPYVGKKRAYEICRVGELSGCLSITEYTGKGFNIWLMKEYGVQDSWRKMYSFPCTVKGERLYERCFVLVTCRDNGEILLAHDSVISSSVFSYNPDLEGFRRIGSGRARLRVIPYRPSLVLLKDSMLGYEVHVSALKHMVMSRSPDWWTPSVEKRTTSKSSAPESSVVMATLQHGNEFVDPWKEQIEQLKQKKQQLEEILQNERVKVRRAGREATTKRAAEGGRHVSNDYSNDGRDEGTFRGLSLNR